MSMGEEEAAVRAVAGAGVARAVGGALLEGAGVARAVGGALLEGAGLVRAEAEAAVVGAVAETIERCVG